MTEVIIATITLDTAVRNFMKNGLVIGGWSFQRE
jgi:hypothetical protein